MTAGKSDAHGSGDKEVLLSVYSVIAARRTAYDALFWQAPVLSLTAQAFLFTVALSGGTPVWSRRIAAGLALLSALASIQLMVKHRFQETSDSITCSEIERQLEIDKIYGSLPHGKPSQRTHARDAKGLEKLKSYPIWLGLLSLFATVAVVVVVLTFTNVFKP
jgi:hypothetical protein